MMGRHHVVTGALAGMGLALVAVGPAHPKEGLCLVLAAGGAAVLPDLDEPGSSAAHLAGFLTVPLAWATGKLSGGHRHATHSLIGAFVFTGFAALLVSLSGAFCVAVAVGLSGAFAWRVGGPLGLRSGVFLLAAAVGAGYLGYTGAPGMWFVAASGLGYLAHLAGDMATTGGVALFWPTERHIALPVLGDTGSVREAVVALGLTVMLVILAYHFYAGTVSSTFHHVALSLSRRHLR